MKKYIIEDSFGAIVCGFSNTLEEAIFTRSEKDFLFFNSEKDAQNFINKCIWEDDLEIKIWNK